MNFSTARAYVRSRLGMMERGEFDWYAAFERYVLWWLPFAILILTPVVGGFKALFGMVMGIALIFAVATLLDGEL